jgi:hypothetical protein
MIEVVLSLGPELVGSAPPSSLKSMPLSKESFLGWGRCRRRPATPPASRSSVEVSSAQTSSTSQPELLVVRQLMFSSSSSMSRAS